MEKKKTVVSLFSGARLCEAEKGDYVVQYESADWVSVRVFEEYLLAEKCRGYLEKKIGNPTRIIILH